jgi:hypothetical protein
MRQKKAKTRSRTKLKKFSDTFEAKFIAPDWRDKVDYGIGDGEPARQATYSRLHPVAEDYEFDYW